jgi:hypothetical protein
MSTRLLLSAAWICGSLALGTGLTACDRAAVESTKTTETPSGTKVEKTKVVEHNDGSVSKETDSKTINTNP